MLPPPEGRVSRGRKWEFAKQKELPGGKKEPQLKGEPPAGMIETRRRVI